MLAPDVEPFVVRSAVFADGKLRGERDGEPFETALEDLVAIRFENESASVSKPGPRLLLAAGEVLPGRVVAIGEEDLTLKWGNLGTFSVPLSAVSAIAFGRDELGDLREFRDRYAITEPPSDTVVLRNRDVVGGTVLGLDEEKLRLGTAERDLAVSREYVAAVLLDPTLTDYEIEGEFHALLTIVDGGTILARTVANSGDPAFLDVETMFGENWTIRRDAVVEMAFRNGRIVYLSDMEPVETVAEPFLDQPLEPKWDRSATGGTLLVDGVAYSKGIGVRSRTRLTYSVSGFERFRSIASLDDAAGPQASVRFVVELDGSVAFDSGAVDRSSPSISIDLPLDRAERLSLVVDYALRADVQDFADWADARLTR